jgi:hypothetical protein
MIRIVKSFNGQNYAMINNHLKVFDEKLQLLFTLEAIYINENAIYNWYDKDGQLLQSGRVANLSITEPTDINLEVISLIDNTKYKDILHLDIKKGRIESITPNPTSNIANVSVTLNNYSIGTYLILTNGQISNFYPVTSTSQNLSLDLSNMPQGVYNLLLSQDNQFIDAKTILKND